MTETEDEPLTLPPLKWTYREDPEPSWRAENYVITVCASNFDPSDPKFLIRPFEVKCGQSETWHERTFVKAKETAEQHRLRNARIQRERKRRRF
jgi:hypothetical protein